MPEEAFELAKEFEIIIKAKEQGSVAHMAEN